MKKKCQTKTTQKVNEACLVTDQDTPPGNDTNLLF